MSSTKTKLKLGDNYLSGQIITYMGNKRKLLPIISDIIDNIKTELGYTELTIGDGFAGSGIVSRLFKTKAQTVYTNDLAGYSKTLNECYLSTPDEGKLQQIKTYIDTANAEATDSQTILEGAMPPHSRPQAELPPFISGNWSPATPIITEADRVYFTYENGKRIDAIRNYIDTIPLEYRAFLLAPLLVQCSIHNNTNGQFSAFYKDATASKGAYGGKNGIDLKRITHPITLPYPLLELDHPCEIIISQLDTNIWARNLKNNNVEMDIVYYDPPYNKHPYNNYYFLLNIINTWDKTITIPRGNRGQSNRTKSIYNSTTTTKVKDVMNDLLLNTNAKYIILSYNDGGIIPIAELDALLAKHGKSVEKIPIDHKTYNRLKGISNYKRTKEYKAVKEFMYVVTK